MADDFDDLDEEVGGSAEAQAAGSEEGGNKKLLLIIGLALFLVLGGVAAAYFTGLLDPLIAMITGGEAPPPEDVPAEEEAIVHTNTFVDLPEVVVNLNTGGKKNTFLKIRVSLELARGRDATRIEELQPRIVDHFQTYLRELRVDDIKGSAGMWRLKEELLARVNAAVAPVRVNDVLFKEMLIQ